MEELDEVSIYSDLLNHKVQIGARLQPDLCLSLIDFLNQHHDYFAWSHTNITYIDPEVMVHHVQVDPDYPPVK